MVYTTHLWWILGFIIVLTTLFHMLFVILWSWSLYIYIWLWWWGLMMMIQLWIIDIVGMSCYRYDLLSIIRMMRMMMMMMMLMLMVVVVVVVAVVVVVIPTHSHNFQSETAIPHVNLATSQWILKCLELAMSAGTLPFCGGIFLQLFPSLSDSRAGCLPSTATTCHDPSQGVPPDNMDLIVVR